MSWDIALNNRHTLRGGIVTGDDEILQRLWIRLNRELGEWFLNTEVGLPWYQGGYGMLGAKPSRKNDIDLLIRQEIANTEGVLQILKFKTLYATGTRLYDAYCSILLQSKRTVEVAFGVAMQSGGSGMPVIPASFIRFESGKTLQDLYDSGELQGPEGLPGKSGTDGAAATIQVGTTVNIPPGSNAYVNNVGTDNAAVLDFGIPYGANGVDGTTPTVLVGPTTTVGPDEPAGVVNTGTDTRVQLVFSIPRGAEGVDGKAATVTVGSTTTGDAGSSAAVTNSGTSSEAVLDFTIPRGSDGESANVEIAGGATIGVTETSGEGGFKRFTLSVIDNAHKHTVNNITDIATAAVATATKLAIARTIGLSGDATGAVSFDGSSDVVIPATVTNAATADELTTARNIVLTGDVTGSASFKGNANVTIATKTDGGLIK